MALGKLLRALIQAEAFLVSHPKARTSIIPHRLNTVPGVTGKGFTYNVSLDSGLLLIMEDEAAWMIQNRLTNRDKIPNFMDSISPEALLKVDPKAVHLAKPGPLLIK